MNVETTLISKIVQTGAIEKTIARGIEAEHFEDETCQVIYEIMCNHVRQYKVPPSPEVIKNEIAALEKKYGRKITFVFEVSQDALEYLIDKFEGLIKFRATTQAVRELAAKTQDENNWNRLDEDALEIARHLAMVVPSSEIGLLSNVDSRIKEYELRKAEGRAWGIKIGIPSLDLLTMGLQSHQLAAIAGWMGLGKSTLLQYMLFNAYLQDKTPMMVSGEMEAEALFHKWDTMAANLEYSVLKAMKLGEGDMRRWEEWGEKASSASADRDIIVIDDIGRLTVDKVFSETVRHNPDLVAVDYIGLMDAPSNIGSTWEKVTYCTKALKQNARILNVAHIIVAQTNRDDGGSGAELGNLAGSLSIGRDADQIYGMFQDDTMKEMDRMEVRLIKSRDSKIGKSLMEWDPEKMHFRELSAHEAFEELNA